MSGIKPGMASMRPHCGVIGSVCIIRTSSGGTTNDSRCEANARRIGRVRRARGRDPARLQFRRRRSADAICTAGRADKPAYIDPRGSWTYGQLADRVDALRLRPCARWASDAKSVCCIALLDTVDWPTAFLGALKAGIVAVPVNTLLTEDDYRFMLADSRARMPRRVGGAVIRNSRS